MLSILEIALNIEHCAEAGKFRASPTGDFNFTLTSPATTKCALYSKLWLQLAAAYNHIRHLYVWIFHRGLDQIFVRR